MNFMEGICGKIAPGLCRLTLKGGIAVRTRAGYRTYDFDKKQLINCDGFAMDVGEDFFFAVPTNRVRPGDIILVGGTPRCVLSADGGLITAIHFEDATVETIVPERHFFMGNTYLYGKIVSLFGPNGAGGKKGAGRMMKYMMFSSLMRGKDGGMGPLLPLMLAGKDDLFGDLMEDLDDEDEKEA